MREGGIKVYRLQNVLDAARERLTLLFERFEHVVVSVSGGKDSPVLFSLALAEARRRERTLHVFFIDQEAEYAATIEQVRWAVQQPGVERHWYQVPVRLTNATSYLQAFLHAWGPGEQWMRPKDPLAIHAIEGEHPQRFYPFIEWFEQRWPRDRTCFLVGLRAEESLNRFRAVIKNPGLPELPWTTVTRGIVKAYPLYDWTYEDVWHHICIEGLSYNRIYDFLWRQGLHIQEVRVSNLIHEHSFKCLARLHEFEPDTYDRLVARMMGAHVAERYAREGMVYDARERPAAFATWRGYRDFLLGSTPTVYRERFERRFAGQPEDEYICRQQCRQVLLNDWENNIGIHKRPEKDALAKWREIL